jgi:HPt (histidine-containing phosphotransfer) domain-containing protein
MNDYVTKPIDPERLFTVLAGQMQHTPERAAAAGAAVTALTAAAVAQDHIPALPGIDMEAALARLGGNVKLLNVLLQRFVGDFAPVPERLLAAIENGAYEQAALLVHKVRGAAGNLSMPELHRASGELEQQLMAPQRAPLEDALAAFAAALERVLDGVQAQRGDTRDQIASVSP